MSINFIEDTYSYHMDLLNGSLDIPKFPGAYAISTGCGSGKTTIIKKIIEQKYNYGVIVFCKTIRECNELYDHTITFIRSTDWSMVYDDNCRLHEYDIINLCSEPRLEKIGDKMVCTNGVDLNWKSNLDIIGRKKVVIATHSVLMNTPINKLMIVGENSPIGSMYEDGLAGGFRYIIRKFMLIDEIPLNEPIHRRFNISGLQSLMDVHEVLIPNPYNPSNVTHKFKFYRRSGNTYNSFLRNYRMSETLDPSYRFESKNTDLNNHRKDMILTSLYHTMELKGNEALDTGRDSFVIKYNLPSMLMTGGINTNIWLFEGTGDITLSKSLLYRLMSYPLKYNGETVDIIKIPNYLKSRNVNIDKMFSKKDEVISSLERNIDMLESIIRSNKETLIIVWKNLRARYVSEDKEYTENLAKFILNDEFNLPEYYRSRLEGRLIGTNHKFHIIHYGSGLDLSTNEFKNCDSIVRLGMFQIPNDSLNEINDNIGSNMDMSDFMLYQNVQALSRTMIRLHKGLKIRFYISEDFNCHIGNLCSYLDNEGCNIRLLDRTLSNVNKKTRERLNLLSNEYDRNILSKVLSGDSYSFDININDLFRLIPMSKKESGRYSVLINELSLLGITMNIITNNWNK